MFRSAMTTEVEAWTNVKNDKKIIADWQFTTADAVGLHQLLDACKGCFTSLQTKTTTDGLQWVRSLCYVQDS